MAIAILILVLFVFGLSFLCANLYAYWKKADKDRDEALKLQKEWEVFGQATKEENDSLAKYRPILEVEAHISQIQAEAAARLDSVNADIQQKESILKEADDKAMADLQAKINQVEADSQMRLASINSQLKETEAKAHEAQDLLTATRNIVEGYGNEYLVAKDSLLDQLAEEYGYAKAARNLKEARNITREMIRKGSAAFSGLSDAQQNEAAKDFLVDAFNGRVDAVLEKVRNEGYGVLKQQVKDIYEVVNESGRYFSNTRITEDFLRSRQEEIKWAVKVYEIREKEKEEQRMLKEQQRDEALAQREIENAQKEAQKKIEEDERVRKRAHEETEKVRRALSTAQESERNFLEERLREAEERARAAEEQVKLSEDEKERAKSLAQQTKRGKVYIISNVGSFGEGVFKIGMTRRIDHEERIKELGDASVPFEFDVHAIIQSDNVPELEKSLHRNLTFHRVNKSNWRKEFFKVPLEKLRKIIEGEGHETEWTLKARALQWRETQEIEKRIEKDEKFKQQWASRQATLNL